MNPTRLLAATARSLAHRTGATLAECRDVLDDCGGDEVLALDRMRRRLRSRSLSPSPRDDGGKD